ncbi:MAG: hypothetical protein RL728_821 [Bacteroidota bacterium]|jgi:hypothetical protein
MLKFLLTYIIILFFTKQAIAVTNCLYSDTVICKGVTIKLTSPKVGLFSYKWSTGATTESIEVSPSQTTDYTVESSSTSGIFTDIFRVIVDVPLPAPQISFVTDKLVSTYNPLFKIRWVKNNMIISGLNNDTLKFPSQGVYRSEISSLGGCWTSSQLLYVFQDIDTAANMYTAIVFPNPNTGYFNVLISVPQKVSKLVEIVVKDIGGLELFKTKQFIFQSASAKIPIRLPAGYKGNCILSINFSGIVKSQQIVIQ